MNINFNGKKAIVTGAGKGIGRCMALKLSQLGAKVFALSRTAEDLTTLNQEDPTIETHCLDLGDWNNTRTVVTDIGPVDFLVNNAAIVKGGTIQNLTEEQVDEMFNVNFKAALNISQVVANGIIERGGTGAIVNISSISSFLAVPGIPIYCTTKAALDMLTKSMALEFAKKKIRVNGINPSHVNTPLSQRIVDTPEKKKSCIDRVPIGRFIEQEEVVNTAVFLLSHYASGITGATVPVDGGHTIHMSSNPL